MQKLCKYRFHWYELDQPLKVGEVVELTCVKGSEPLEIHSGFTCSESTISVHCKIVSIHHPELGYIKNIDTEGLDYCLTLANGKSLSVEAEEDPGNVYSFPIKPKAWNFQVLIEITT
ncbi:hypothetical protein MHO82_25560 [Vibrio sp. Of7-15]|uniref:hypothetical protein n=1 Tax=Vibrio sp. Of7-15 TaxID=2724879 RepID=UPI001EF30B62|nr:hypothetical protein [Vibrio sp. Of7-15]MCG7500219.1 hypothetical protein [Vibrio sp. Of7-15]